MTCGKALLDELFDKNSNRILAMMSVLTKVRGKKKTCYTNDLMHRFNDKGNEKRFRRELQVIKCVQGLHVMIANNYTCG